MKKILIIFICFLMITPGFAKDPIKRGKSAFSKDRPYPQMDISGYEELEFNKLDQSGDSKQYTTRAEYLQIPADTKVYDGWRHRRLIDLEGQINDKLYVRYKIFQDPDLPQETDIYVEYDKFSIYFGKYDAGLTNGDLFAMNKNIDGLHADYIDENQQFEAIYGEERSHERTFSSPGSGQREYSLGQANILEGSLKIRINGQSISESDYTVNYMDGRIIFNRIISNLETIDATYEYLDPIEDFLPISSKVRLSGIQHRYKTYTGVAPIIATKSAEYVYTKPLEILRIAPWDELEKTTRFSYGNRALTVTVSNTALISVKLMINNEQVPLQLVDRGVWRYTLPLNIMDRRVTLSYDCGQYQFERGYDLAFVPTVSVTEIPIVSVLENSVIVTNDATAVIVVPAAQYQCVYSDVRVVLPAVAVVEDSSLQATLTSVNSLVDPTVQFLTPEQIRLQRVQDGSYSLSLRVPTGVQPGLNFCYISCTSTSNAVIVHKVPFFVLNKAKPPIIDHIDLPQHSLISFTESVTLNGQRLVFNDDYKMDYDTGAVQFLKEFPDSAQVTVGYTYYENEATRDSLKGNATQGPYQLTHQMLVPGSVEIRANGILLIPNEDFKVDAPNGKITFSKRMSEVEIADIAYRYYIIGNASKMAQRKEAFTMSSYFVQEQAKAAEANADSSRVVEGDELSVTVDGVNTTIRISDGYMPIVKNSIKLYIDEVEVSATSLSVSEYNGEISVAGNVSTHNLKVELRQAKAAFAPKISFSGNNSSTVVLQDLYPNFPKPIVYVDTFDNKNILLEKKGPNDSYYIPLEYKKDYIIGRPSDILLVSNTDYAVVTDNADAWMRGMITFVTGNKSTQYTAISPYGTDTQFRFNYKVSDVDSPDPGDITHQTYGSKVFYAPNESVNFGIEYNESRKRFQRTTLADRIMVTGNGLPDFQIQLKVSGSATIEIVEDSEKLFINDRLQTRNDNYFLTYKGGLISFKSGLIIGPTDVVRVEYEYYTPGVGTAEQFDEKAKAVKVDTTIHVAKTDITATYVTVDSKYDPVGNAPAVYKAGTEAKKLQVVSQPIERLNLNSSVERFDTKLGAYTDDQTTDRMGKKVAQAYGATYGFNTNDQVSLITHRNDIAEPALTRVASTNYAVDTTDYDGQLDVKVGAPEFRTDFMARNATILTDVLDREAMTRKYNRNGRVQNIYKPWTELSLSSVYNQNNDDEFSTIRRSAFTKSYSELLRYTPWTIDTSLEYAAADYRTEQSLSDMKYDQLNRIVGKDRKQVFNFTFRRPQELADPLFEEFFVHFDDMYASVQPDVFLQQPNVNRADNLSTIIRPYDVVSLGFEDRYSRLLAENHKRAEYMKENVYRLSRFYPGKYLGVFNQDFLIMNKIEISRKIDERRSDTLVGDTFSSYAKNNSFTTLQSYTLNPLDFMVINYQQNNSNLEGLLNEYKSLGQTETQTLEPKFSYTLGVESALDKFADLSFLKYTWNKNYANSRIHRTVFDVGGSRLASKDDLEKQDDAMALSYKYWGSFANKHTLTLMDEFKTKTLEGVRLTQGHTDALDIRYDTPITGLGLTYGLTRIANTQYKHIAESVNRYSIRQRYNDKLLRWDNTDRLMADYTPIDWFTADASYYTNTITQRIAYNLQSPTNSSYIANQIRSKAYEFGATLRPLEDLSARYGWKRSLFDLGFGEESKFTAEYKPMKLVFGNITYHYENIFTYGKGTNAPEQEFNMNDLQGYVRTSVIDRRDVKVINTLVVRVNRDIANVIVDNIIIDINLTRLHLWDMENPEYSYSVDAFYAKGTMNF